MALVELAIGVVGFGAILRDPELVDIPAFTGILVARGVPLITLAWLCLILPSAMAMGAALWIYAGAHKSSFPLWFGLGFVALFLFQGGAGVGVVAALGTPGSLVDSLLLIAGLGVFLLFPNGNWWPRWSRWAYPVLCIPVLTDLTLTQDLRRALTAPGTPIDRSRFFSVAAPLSLLALVVIAQTLRYRRHSNVVERLQTRWVLVSSLFWSIPILGSFVSILAGVGETLLGLLVGIATGFSYFIPIACAVAVSKYRLYELDRVVSRTVSYAVVAGSIGLLYVAGVGLVRFLLPASGALAVAASTLGAVVVISPLYRRVRDVVDRRFHRARYDAQLVSAAFANHLQSALNIDELVDDIVEVLRKTVQPRSAAVWTAVRPEASTGPGEIQSRIR